MAPKSSAVAQSSPKAKWHKSATPAMHSSISGPASRYTALHASSRKGNLSFNPLMNSATDTATSVKRSNQRLSGSMRSSTHPSSRGPNKMPSARYSVELEMGRRCT